MALKNVSGLLYSLLKLSAILLFFVYVSPAYSKSIFETKTSEIFNKIKDNPLALNMFLEKMPKGADLHNHLSGAAYAENMIRYAVDAEYCLNTETLSLFKQSSCKLNNRLKILSSNYGTYNKIINFWSMRDFISSSGNSGHKHFFNTFDKFHLIASQSRGKLLAGVQQRAYNENISYLELMISPNILGAINLGNKIKWQKNFSKSQQHLISAGLKKVVSKAKIITNLMEKQRDKSLACNSTNPNPSCNLKIKYLYQIMRAQPPSSMFAQLLVGFELCKSDSRFVGINIVQAEDRPIALKDYVLQMKMIGYLHNKFPKVHISLHAGELTTGLVMPKDLKFHIRDAVNIAHAERIGHGVDIAYENNSKQLLKEMADKKIMIEINLTSNADILNVVGNNHPLPLYIDYKVPVALSTDDEGVLRTDLTQEYKRAVLTYNFTYKQLKQFARNSLTFSFLPGKSLWKNSEKHKVVNVCQNIINNEKLNSQCRVFLQESEKARLQWNLEKRFRLFENRS